MAPYWKKVPGTLIGELERQVSDRCFDVVTGEALRIDVERDVASGPSVCQGGPVKSLQANTSESKISLLHDRGEDVDTMTPVCNGVPCGLPSAIVQAPDIVAVNDKRNLCPRPPLTRLSREYLQYPMKICLSFSCSSSTTRLENPFMPLEKVVALKA
jgi:hypothetical protein